MNRLERRYYINEDGSEDNLVQSVDCIEKILYHALRDYEGIDYIYAFCDDINICHNQYSDESKFLITSSKLNLNRKLFNYKIKSVLPHHAIASVEKAIDNGVCIAVCTMFDMLPPYYWYQKPSKIGVSNTHWCLIVGYDKENLFFADSPDMLVAERMQTYPSNPTIGIISKSIMVEAFKKYCALLTVNINTKELPHIDNFDEVFKAVLLNYYTPSIVKDGVIFNKGRSALVAMIQSAEHTKFLDHVAGDYYIFYLQAKRREIFKSCMIDKQSRYTDIKSTLEALDASIKSWNALHYLFMRHYHQPYKNLRERMQKMIADMISLEDQVVNALSKIVFTRDKSE